MGMMLRRYHRQPEEVVEEPVVATVVEPTVPAVEEKPTKKSK